MDMKYSEVSASASSDSDAEEPTAETGVPVANHPDIEPPSYSSICSPTLSPSASTAVTPLPVTSTILFAGSVTPSSLSPAPVTPVPLSPVSPKTLTPEPLSPVPPTPVIHAPVISISKETPSSFCYTPVILAPLSDINQVTFLSDTDSTVSTVPEIMCRICRCEPGSEKIISPCYCAGSLQHVHESCLLKWLKAYDCVNKHHCELCQYEFKLKAKPWTEWRIPSLSQTEKRRVSCLGIVCFLAVLIVLWSINDLVQNSLHINRIYTDWGFWTKLLFIVFGLFILTFQYPTFKYFYLKLRESNQIVLWGEEGEEQELLETGKLRKCLTK